MNTAWSEALREAYALAPKGVVYLETLQIAHASLGSSTIYIVKNLVDLNMRTEDAVLHTFKAAGFRLQFPPTGDQGVQNLGIEIGDTEDQKVTSFCKAAKEYVSPVKVTVRVYLSTDLNNPQNNPPLVLNLTDIVITNVVTGRCTFAGIVNEPFLKTLYKRDTFPGLANL